MWSLVLICRAVDWGSDEDAYAISTDVTIAVPFSPESPNAPAIYVPARVVNIAELPELKCSGAGGIFARGGNEGAQLK